MAETKTNIPVEIKMGNAGANNSNLPAFKEGSIIFTKDTKKIYIDPVGETERIAVGGGEVDLSGKQDIFCDVQGIHDGDIIYLSGYKYWDKNTKKYIQKNNAKLLLDNILTQNVEFRGLGTKYIKLETNTDPVNLQLQTQTGEPIVLVTPDNVSVIKEISLGKTSIGPVSLRGDTDDDSRYLSLQSSDGSSTQLRGIEAGIKNDDAVNVQQLNSAIATQVSSVYKAKGSITDLSSLPTPDKAHGGFVYNIENEFTTTDLFVEGAGKTYPAGTNIVIVNTTGTEYKYDVLAGMVDLSDYATKTELSGKLDKVTSTSKYNRLYGIETTGNQALFNVAAYVLAGSIAQRKADGTLNATTPTADSSDDTVTTKKYVDDLIGNINSILATMFNDVSTQNDEESTDEEVIA